MSDDFLLFKVLKRRTKDRYAKQPSIVPLSIKELPEPGELEGEIALLGRTFWNCSRIFSHTGGTVQKLFSVHNLLAALQVACVTPCSSQAPQNDLLVLWDVSQEVPECKNQLQLEGALVHHEVHDNLLYISVSSHGKGILQVWNLESSKWEFKIELEATVPKFAIHSGVLLCGSVDGTCTAIDLQNVGEGNYTFAENRGEITSFLIHDGLLFTSSLNGSICKWYMGNDCPRTLKLAHIWEGHTGAVTDLAVLSKDSETKELVSCSADGTLR